MSPIISASIAPSLFPLNISFLVYNYGRLKNTQCFTTAFSCHKSYFLVKKMYCKLMGFFPPFTEEL